MMIHTLRNCVLALSVLLAASCTDESVEQSRPVEEGQEVMVGLSISAAPESRGMPGTRAIEEETVDEGTGTDYKILDFWLLEYNQNGLLIGSPRYYVMSELGEPGEENIFIPVIRPAEAGTEYRCVLLANTHSPAFSATLAGANTLGKLKTLYKNVRNLSDMYSPENGAGTGDLFMSGEVPVRHDTEKLDCQLYRNIAKLTLKLTNAAESGVKIVSVQLRNVPDRLFYADRLYKDAPAPSPTLEESGFIDLPVEECVLTSGSTEKTLVYYLPRNCRGTNGADVESQKNVNAPNYATFLEIMAEDAEAGTPLRYRFYLGSDMINDFNVRSNHHYTLPITINSKGDAQTDNRVEDLGMVELAESNSYLINPTSGEAQTIYSVPITRINKFWSSADGQRAGTSIHIAPDTEWEAEVIWQDKSRRLINFCAPDGKVTDGNTTYSGKGESFFHFRPVQGAAGNVVIGVRKKGYKDEYLWSWHLWITDYNPAYTSAWQEGDYSYVVDGGHVHRYAGTVWEAKYNNKYIMDRNLGAEAASREAGVPKTRGMCYQFGRKDPFPLSKTALYGIDGNAQQIFTPTSSDCIDRVAGSTWFYIAVQRPFSFYTNGSGDWARDNAYTGELWNNPTWNNTESGKSLFDPCPPGWKLPELGTYDIFATTIEGTGSRPNASNYSIEQGENDYQGNTENAGWLFYMSAVGEGETTWYPASGYRSSASGAVEIERRYGYCWFATPRGATNGRNLSFDSTGANPRSSFVRASGFPVRCVQE